MLARTLQRVGYGNNAVCNTTEGNANMVTINAKLEKGHWVANEHDVEVLAHERYANALAVSQLDTTYLKVILVASQAKLGKSRRRTAALSKADIETQVAVLQGVHERFYPHVLKGITTDDIAIENGLDTTESRRRSLERNARSAFARSAYSTLRAYAEAGGDLRALDPATTSKVGLRKALAPPEPTDRIARAIQRSQKALMRAIARQAQRDADTARETIEATVEALNNMLEQLGGETEAEETGTTTVVGRAPAERATQRTRVGVPLLNRGA